ncbi:unnamed protein product [Gemmata massiliana]|uniref:ParB/Sulfiredoxin domain-containing protein n=1 Tax=Gemmata massiliana TaxID=1210884 RepID=A0A6P2D1I5_9BACT|nr:hypothetical protein [Gemmata massiliana]VTR93282.1 unnamed protein product [Gemmata massiliana]
MPDASVPTVRLGNLTFHLPFAGLLRPLSPLELTELRTSISRHNKVLSRAVTYDSATWGTRCVIDGANRLQIAAELDLDVPVQHRGAMSDEDARAECLDLNLARRHLTVEELEAARTGRILRVMAAKEEGQSTRAIARAEGVSQTQILRDLAVAAAPAPTVAPVPETDVSHDDQSVPEPDPARPLAVMQRSFRQIMYLSKSAKSGALPELLAGPLGAHLSRIAARHGVPLAGDRWPALEVIVAVVSDLAAEAAQGWE